MQGIDAPALQTTQGMDSPQGSAAQDGPSFDSYLEGFEQLHDPSVQSMPSVDPGKAAQATDKAEDPTASDTVGQMFDHADDGYHRLNELMGQLDEERVFKTRELLRMQIEVHNITMQLETTSKAVTETASNTKQLFNQQI